MSDPAHAPPRVGRPDHPPPCCCISPIWGRWFIMFMMHQRSWRMDHHPPPPSRPNPRQSQSPTPPYRCISPVSKGSWAMSILPCMSHVRQRDSAIVVSGSSFRHAACVIHVMHGNSLRCFASADATSIPMTKTLLQWQQQQQQQQQQKQQQKKGDNNRSSSNTDSAITATRAAAAAAAAAAARSVKAP